MDDVLGSLAVQITGDYSELEDSITSAAGIAESGAAKIADAFAVPVGDAIVASLGTLVDDINAAGQAAEASGAQFSLFGQDASSALGDMNTQMSLFDTNGIAAADEAFGSLAVSAGDAVAPVQEVGSAGQEAESGLAGMVEQLTLLGEALVITEGLKEFGQEALTAYGTVQSVTIGLTALTGSAEQADQIIGQVKELAATEPFAFPEIAPTVQKMVALGVSTEQVGTVMQAAADASAATGNAFSQVANMLDRMSLSGTVNARSMATLGISLVDLGNAMGVTSTEAAAAFKALDQSARIDVLASALSKFAGTAIAEAQGIAGQWQIFQNTFEEAMVGIGESLAPAVGKILDFGKDVLGVVQVAIQGFGALPGPVQDVAIALGLIAAAAVPVTAGLAAIGLAATGLAAIPEIFAALTTAIGLTAAADTALATEAGTATVALEAEGAAAVTTAGEMDTAAAAAGAGGLTGALRLLGPAAGAAAAVFAGWSFGVWAADAKSAAQQLQDLSGYARDLGLKLNDADASGTEFAASLKKLETEAAAEGIVIDNSGKSQKQYAVELLGAMQASDDAALAAYNLGHAEDAADVSTKSHIQSADQLRQKIEDLKQSLFDANTALIEVGTDHQNDANYAMEHAAAVQQVSAAQKALDAAIGITTASLKAHKDSLDAVDTSAAKVTQDYLTATATWLSVKEAFDNGTASLVQLGIASENADKATAAYAKTIQSAGQATTTAATAVSNLATVIENGKNVLVPYAGAVADASTSTEDFSKSMADEYQAFDQAAAGAADTTDGIVQLRGATDAAKQGTDDLSSSWVYANGVWQTGADLLASLKPLTDDETTSMDALGASTQAAADAQSNLNNAQTSSKGGGGGGKGGGAMGDLLASGFVAPADQGFQAGTGGGAGASPYPFALGAPTGPAVGFAFASGGIVTQGTANLIGEEGPELFIPDQTGTILPAGTFSIADASTLGTTQAPARMQIDAAPTNTPGVQSTYQGSGPQYNPLYGTALSAMPFLAGGPNAPATGTAGMGAVAQDNPLAGTGLATLTINGQQQIIPADHVQAVQDAMAQGVTNINTLLEIGVTGLSTLPGTEGNTFTPIVQPEGGYNVVTIGGQSMLVDANTAAMVQEAASLGANNSTLQKMLAGGGAAADLLTSIVAATGGPVAGQSLTMLTPAGLPPAPPPLNPGTGGFGLGEGSNGGPNITINFAGAQVYGTQGAQMVAQSIVNTLKTSAGQLRY